MKNLSETTFAKYLKRINACLPARKWVGDMDFETAWQTCQRGDWMLWLIQEAGLCDLRTLTLAKARCAELARPYMRDERSLAALDAAFAFAEGRITEEELAAAAYAAAAYAAYAAAAYAAYAAAAYAAYAAAAYAAAANAAARTETLKKCADICREVLPNPKIQNVK